jgi:predicted acetyltransferase
VELLRVSYEQKIILRNLMELYQYDMSPYEDERENDVNEFGLYDYKYLDHYWTEEGRYPYLVIQSGKLAGFVLVREIKTASDATPNYSMAEFFILKKYRKQSIGKEAAFKVFEMFKGNWSIAWLEKNLSAQAFWTKVISEYKAGEYSKTMFSGNPAIEFCV